jgi:uncharacterized peroxidase-related enzyme
MSAWIKMLSDDEAPAIVREALDTARTPHGTVDNVMRVHSLRPHTMYGHVALYRSVLHDDGNTLPMWFQETIASYVSLLNKCDYSLQNHWSNANYLINDDARSDVIYNALENDKPEEAFTESELAMLNYARKLTLHPSTMVAADVEALQSHDVPDGEILEVNQIVGYFCYVNRLLNGLGVTTDGDVVGYYAESDE